MYKRQKQTGPSGKLVSNLYVEAGCAIAHEYYLALLIDREEASILIMASTEGGVDIEEVAETNPEAIHKAWIDPLDGLQDEQKGMLADSLGLSGPAHASFVEMIGALASIFVDTDCSMIEINPLVRTEDGTMVALLSLIHI